MDNFEQLLDQTKEQLFALPEVKMYFDLREQIKENREIQTLLLDIRTHQKAMTGAMEQLDVYQTEKALYHTLMSRYNTHPLIVNYEVVKEQVYLLLKQIQTMIES